MLVTLVLVYDPHSTAVQFDAKQLSLDSSCQPSMCPKDYKYHLGWVSHDCH